MPSLFKEKAIHLGLQDEAHILHLFYFFSLEKEADDMLFTFFSFKWGRGFLDLKNYFSTYFQLKTPNTHNYNVNKPMCQLKTPLNWFENSKSNQEKNSSFNCHLYFFSGKRKV